MICKDSGTNKEHVKSKMTKSLIFIGVLSHACLSVFHVGMASVPLGANANTRSVVWRADKFDAGGFQSVFDCIEVGSGAGGNAACGFHAFNCSNTYCT